MLNFADFIKEWEFGGSESSHQIGARVRVNDPGHANHGKQGRILRHQGVDSLVDFGAGHQPSWHNRVGALKPV